MDGAGSVEETLAKLMNESIFMVDNAEMKKAEAELNFYVPLDAAFQEKKLSMLQNSIIKRMAAEEEEHDEIDNTRKKKETFFITVDAVHVKLTFWLGFISLEDAQLFKNKLSKEM